MTPFPVGSIITHKGVDYCVLSSKRVAHGWQVTAILANGDSGWWYGFYFPTRDPLPPTNSRANFQDGRQGVEGDRHGR
jgi:hypothetical protein